MSKPVAQVLRHIEQIQEEFGLIDATMRTILHRIALFESAGQHIAVCDVLSWDDIASAATLHGRLDALRDQKLLGVAKAEDRRLKIVRLSSHANSYFKKIATAMGACAL